MKVYNEKSSMSLLKGGPGEAESMFWMLQVPQCEQNGGHVENGDGRNGKLHPFPRTQSERWEMIRRPAGRADADHSVCMYREECYSQLPAVTPGSALHPKRRNTTTFFPTCVWGHRDTRCCPWAMVRRRGSRPGEASHIISSAALEDCTGTRDTGFQSSSSVYAYLGFFFRLPVDKKRENVNY